MLLEQIRLNDVDHLLHLTEDEDSMLRERSCCARLRVQELALRTFARQRRIGADPAICEKLTSGGESMGVMV